MTLPNNIAASARIARVENPTIRGIYEAIEKERVRQGRALSNIGSPAYTNGLSRCHPENLQMRTIAAVLDTLDIEVILVNREGDQL